MGVRSAASRDGGGDIACPLSRLTMFRWSMTTTQAGDLRSNSEKLLSFLRKIMARDWARAGLERIPVVPMAVLRLLLVLAILTIGLAACTTGQGYPQPPPITPKPSPSPTLTAVDEVGACLSDHVLSFPPLLASDLWWPTAIPTPDTPAIETRRGPDPARCPARLPVVPACSEPFPWTGLDPENSFLAMNAITKQEGSMTNVTSTGTGATRNYDVMTLQYTLVQLPADDPAGVRNFANAAMQVCGGATPGEVAGTWVVRGRAPLGTGTAQVSLVQSGNHLLWLKMQGPGWTSAERDRVTAAAITGLLENRPNGRSNSPPASKPSLADSIPGAGSPLRGPH